MVHNVLSGPPYYLSDLLSIYAFREKRHEKGWPKRGERKSTKRTTAKWWPETRPRYAIPRHLLAKGSDFLPTQVSLNPPEPLTSFCQWIPSSTRVRSHLGRPRETRHASPPAGPSFWQDPRPDPQHYWLGEKRIYPNITVPTPTSNRQFFPFPWVSFTLPTVAISSWGEEIM